ncbi:hypothetical protein [Nevskia sp.]|uniref:hypothetical protein n=1 Tax=Nevskia sp. TaxID=1929292 RepID=UPI0025E81BF0|nr:hypothetical protein [Nevskia sp.]
MGTRFWVKRFFVALLGAFVIISAAQMLKGHDLSYAMTQAAIWSVITAAVFTATGFLRRARWRQG